MLGMTKEVISRDWICNLSKLKCVGLVESECLTSRLLRSPGALLGVLGDHYGMSAGDHLPLHVAPGDVWPALHR